MVSKTKRNIILLVLIIAIIGSIYAIEYFQDSGNGDEDLLVFSELEKTDPKFSAQKHISLHP